MNSSGFFTARSPERLVLTMRTATRQDVEKTLLNAIKKHNVALVKAILKNLPESVKKDRAFQERLKLIGEQAGHKEIAALIISKVKELSPVAASHAALYQTPSPGYSPRFGFAGRPAAPTPDLAKKPTALAPKLYG